MFASLCIRISLSCLIASAIVGRAVAFSSGATLPPVTSFVGTPASRLQSTPSCRISACPSGQIAHDRSRGHNDNVRRSSSLGNYRRAGKTHLQSTAIDTIDGNNPFLSRKQRVFIELQTLLRVLLPAIVSGITATLTLPVICHRITNLVIRVTDPAKYGMLNDAVTSFISLVGLLYSILVGQVFGFLYSQQEALYYALFDEVTEAKSLLEQVALVSQGRTMYSTCLSSIARYVQDDLLGGTLTLPPKDSSAINKKDKTPSTPSVTPSLILSARPADDPLEAILYLTSVGIPGQVYDTVRSLRQARARRLGALQRKVPVIHLIMLWILGFIMIGSFPVLLGVGGAASAGGQLTQTLSGYNIWTLQGGLFGVATFAVVMTKMVLGELWRTKGGAYNVDAVLRVMVRGLQKELDERMIEAKKIMKRSNRRKKAQQQQHADRDIQRE